MSKKLFVRKIKKSILPLTWALYLGVCSEVFAGDPFRLLGVREAEGIHPAVGRFAIRDHGIEQEIEMRIENLGYFLSTAPAGGLEPIVRPHLQDGNLRGLNLGESRLLRRYIFTYAGAERSLEDFFGDGVRNVGSWRHIHDHNQRRTLSELVLRAGSDAGQEVQYRGGRALRIATRHDPVGIPGAERDGGIHYVGGNNISLTRYRLQRYRNPLTGREYDANIQGVPEGAIPTHEGRDIVYVYPFALPGQELQEAYEGTYETLGETLTPTQREANEHVKDGPVIYVTSEPRRDGGRTPVIHHTKVTHERWQRDGQEVGFSIVSKKEGEKLKWNEGVNQGVNQGVIDIPEGTYQLKKIKPLTKADGTKKFLETWKRLDGEGEVVIETPERVTAIPGLTTRNFTFDDTNVAVEDMRRRLENTERTVTEGIARYGNRDSLFIIGKSAIGKTVLINALAGRELEAYEEVNEDGDAIIKVRPLDPLLHGLVGGQDGVAGTKSPAPYEAQGLVIWDCPGFDDPGGPTFDIVNSINIQRAIKSVDNGRVRFGLAIEETQFGGNGQDFLNYLNRIAEMVPNVDILKNSLTLIVTKLFSTEGEVRARIRGYYRAQLPDVDGRFRDGRFELTPNALELLRYLTTEEGRGRLICLPRAREAGAFALMPPGELRRKFEAVPGYVHPVTRHIIGRADRAIGAEIDELITVLNNSVLQFLETDWHQGVMNSLQEMVRNHNGDLKTLRTALKLKKTELEQLRDGGITAAGARIHGLDQLTRELAAQGAAWNGNLSEVEVDILDRLARLSTSDSVRTNLSSLKFLKMVKADLTYSSMAQWKEALGKAIASLDEFLGKKESKVDGLYEGDNLSADGKTLTIKRFMMGTKKLQKLLGQPRMAGVKKVNIYAANALFVDENLTASGVSVKAMAPYWHVVGHRTIDLSGKDGRAGRRGSDGATWGANGGHGEPGQHGKNSGHLLLQAHWVQVDHSAVTLEQLLDRHLTLRINGGNGGQGGDGGNGHDGAKGADANKGQVTAETSRTRKAYGVQGYLDDGASPHGHPTSATESYKEVRYEATGESGGKGGDGGKVGAGGKGGKAGSAVLMVGTERREMRSGTTPGVTHGTDGTCGITPGTRGVGGLRGDNSQGVYEKDRHRSAQHCVKQGVWGACSYHTSTDDPAPQWVVENKLVASTDRGGHGTQYAVTDLVLHADDDQPEVLTPLDTSTTDYQAFYKEKARNPVTSYLVRLFPGLF